MNLESFPTIAHLKKSQAQVMQRLETENENDLYRSALAVQNELHIGEILEYLSGLPKWLSAKNVLDLGCGPGDLIAHLRRHFTDKFYTGVDINENFITMAREQTRGSGNCLFVHADLYDFEQGQYDFVILRAVLQHLKDPDRLMKHLPDLLKENAAVLFLDTTKENFVDAHPPIASFDDFYNRVEAMQKEHTGSRDCIAELEGQLPKHHFKLIESRAASIPITGAENRARVVQYLILGCAISKKMISIHIDMNALFKDLIKWHDVKNSRLNLKYRLMLIEKA